LEGDKDIRNFENVEKEMAPVFYGEGIYNEEDAKEAFEGAKEVLEFVKNLKIKPIKKGGSYEKPKDVY